MAVFQRLLKFRKNVVRNGHGTHRTGAIEPWPRSRAAALDNQHMTLQQSSSSTPMADDCSVCITSSFHPFVLHITSESNNLVDVRFNNRWHSSPLPKADSLVSGRRIWCRLRTFLFFILPTHPKSEHDPRREEIMWYVCTYHITLLSL
jgi:hypothetical protein